MNFTTKDGITFELEVKGDDVVAYNLDKPWLKDQELIFENLWYDLKEFGISEAKYYIGDGDYEWDEDVVKEIAYSHLVADVQEAYENDNFTIKIN